MTFRPTAIGSYSGSVRVDSNVPGSPHFLPLSGTATAPAVGILVAPRRVSFNDQIVGTTSAPQTVALRNVGTAIVTITRLHALGDFAIADASACTVLSPQAECFFPVAFAPSAQGVRTGEVVVESNAVDSFFGIALDGRAVAAPAAQASPSAQLLAFGNTPIGGMGVLPLTIVNTGAADLFISSVAATGDFSVSGNCPPAMTQGEACHLEVGFQPIVPGARAGVLSIISNTPGVSVDVQLAGQGCRIFSFVGVRMGIASCG